MPIVETIGLGIKALDTMLYCRIGKRNFHLTKTEKLNEATARANLSKATGTCFSIYANNYLGRCLKHSELTKGIFFFINLSWLLGKGEKKKKEEEQKISEQNAAAGTTREKIGKRESW